MFDVISAKQNEMDFIIKSAAVGDYRVKEMAPEKIKKKGDVLTLELVKNPDILAYLGAHKPKHQILCGFAMETQDLIANATEKLVKKNCDMIVANNLRTEGAGFGTDTNVVTFIHPDKTETLAQMSKYELGRKILHTLLQKQERITEC
jgi:phosphopantothenoylcysteine decarboxylase/phosphopantothenate--cysteine ligase